MKIAIVGAGFSGLIWAERIQRQGHEIIIFDKAKSLGGVWRTYANQNSRVQMVASDYGFWSRPTKDGPTNFTPRDEILAEAHAFAQSTGILERIQFGTEVAHIERDAEGCTLHLDRDGITSQSRFDGVAILPGTLTRPRPLPIPREAEFEGIVAQGIGDDLDPRCFEGQKVVIVGMGSYAIENAREALMHGAESVTLVARSVNIVAPKIASLRICNHLAWKGQDVLDTLQAPYEALGRTDLLAKLVDGATYSQKTIPPVSDLYFIAQRFGKLSVIEGEVAHALPHGVALASGDVIEADVLLGCVGFERSATAERLGHLLGASELNGMFVDRMGHVAFNFEPVHGGMDAKEGIPFASHLTITRTLADLFVYYLDRPAAFERVAGALPSVSNASGFSGDDYRALFKLVAGVDRDARAIIVHHLAAKVARCEQRHHEHAFLAQNKAEWARLCTAMGGDIADFPYPFRADRGLRRRMTAFVAGLQSNMRCRRIFGPAHHAPEPPASARQPNAPAVVHLSEGRG
ncbi:MAG: FAD-dependent oxidoreductase [Bradymonadia bacterium]